MKEWIKDIIALVATIVICAVSFILLGAIYGG